MILLVLPTRREAQEWRHKIKHHGLSSKMKAVRMMDNIVGCRFSRIIISSDCLDVILDSERSVRDAYLKWQDYVYAAAQPGAEVVHLTQPQMNAEFDAPLNKQATTNQFLTLLALVDQSEAGE